LPDKAFSHGKPVVKSVKNHD